MKTDNTKIKTTNETLKKENDRLKKHRQIVVSKNRRLALLLKNKRQMYTTLHAKLRLSTLRATNNTNKSISYMQKTGNLQKNVLELEKEMKNLILKNKIMI